ncbi:hypothetical protein NYA8BAC_00546 [Psychrobacter okhotskensis]
MRFIINTALGKCISALYIGALYQNFMSAWLGLVMHWRPISINNKADLT